MTEFQRRLEANIRESLRFAVGEVQDDAVAHMVAGVNAVLNHPCAPAPSQHVAGRPVAWFYDFVSDIPRSSSGYRPTLTALTEKEPTPGPNVFNIRPLYEGPVLASNEQGDSE